MGTRTHRAFSLVEILIVAVIIIALAAFLMPLYLKGGRGPGGKRGESPMQRGHSVECINNLSQLRQAYQLATAGGDEDGKPQSIAEFARGIPQGMLRCPVGGQPYSFDPASGRLWCVQPGHERH
jgi:hypothetical protein